MQPKRLTWGQVPSAPHVCLWSPHVVPRTPDWDDGIRIAGYAYPPASETSDYKPPKGLEAFLDAQPHKPVVVFSFGSMTIPRPDRLLSAISGAVKTVGARAVVILPGRPTKYCIDATENSSSSGLFVTDEVPHAWILPRCRGFVHHGAAGHTAAGLRQGVPMLLTPFFLDQNFWAARLRQRGLGPDPIPFRELTEDRLAAALGEMLAVGTGEDYRQRCLCIAREISTDKDGAEVAAATVSQEVCRAEGARCCLIPTLRADWCHEASGLPLCGAAASALEARGIVEWSDLRPYGLPTSGDSRSTELSDVSSVIDVLLWLWEALLIFFSVLLGRGKGTEAGDSAARSPISLALIRKGQYDLGLARNYESARGNDVETQLVRVWESTVGSRFRAGFDSKGRSGVGYILGHR